MKPPVFKKYNNQMLIMERDPHGQLIQRIGVRHFVHPVLNQSSISMVHADIHVRTSNELTISELDERYIRDLASGKNRRPGNTALYKLLHEQYRFSICRLFETFKLGSKTRTIVNNELSFPYHIFSDLPKHRIIIRYLKDEDCYKVYNRLYVHAWAIPRLVGVPVERASQWDRMETAILADAFEDYANDTFDPIKAESYREGVRLIRMALMEPQE